MKSDKLLRYTLTVSLLAHGAVLLPRPNFNPFTPAPKIQEIAVRYIKKAPAAKLPPEAPQRPSQAKMPAPEPFLKLDSPVAAAAGRNPPAFIPAEARAQDQALPAQSNQGKGFLRPSIASSQVMAIKRKVSLPAIEAPKIDNPSYISYYQIVREKIRRSAYQNYTHNETGDVYVSFIISNNGYIKEVRVVDEKTNVNDYLKNVALRSIRDASPFPAFPKELDYPQLSFNIIISFEIE